MTDQPRPPSSARRLFSMTILVSEVFVVLFAVLVVVGLRLVPAGAAWAGAAALTVLLVTAAGLLRTRAGYLLGWVAQLALLAVSQRVGGRVDRERRERHAAELAARVEP